MHLSQDDIAYFGLDQLQIRLPVSKWRISIPEINHTNTPEAYIECGEYKFRIRLGFTPSQYAKNLVFELQYQTFDEDTFILTNDYLHAFSYMYGATQGSVTTHNKLVIHSTFFAYMTKSGKNHESIYNFLIQIADIDTSSIRRADIAMDIVNIPRQEVISWFDPDCYSAKIGKKKHEKVHQTHYIGQYEVTKNRNYIVRIYDKVADTTKKMKGFLFGHYSQYSHVTRVEIELRALFFEHVGKGEQDSDFQFFSDFTAKDLLLFVCFHFFYILRIRLSGLYDLPSLFCDSFKHLFIFVKNSLKGQTQFFFIALAHLLFLVYQQIHGVHFLILPTFSNFYTEYISRVFLLILFCTLVYLFLHRSFNPLL